MVGKGVHLLPGVPPGAGCDVEPHRYAVVDDGCPRELERLAGDPLREPDDLVGHLLRMHGPDRRTHGACLDRPHERCADIGRVVELRLGDHGAQPASAHPADDRGDVTRRNVHDHLPRTVQSSGAVPLRLADPPARDRPRLPPQGCVVGVHADPLDLALPAQRHRTARRRVVQGHEQRVARGRVGREGAEAGALAQLGAPGHHVATERLGRDGTHRPGGDHQVAHRLEDGGVVLLGAQRAHLGTPAHDDVVVLWCREPEGDVDGGRSRGVRSHPDEVEEGEVELVRDPVQPVEQRVGHVGEGLDEGDAGVGDVVVGPVGAALLHHPLGVVHEVLEAAVVEVRQGDRHQDPLRSVGGIT